MRPDLIVANSSKVQVFQNTGSGWDATTSVAQGYTTALGNVQETAMTQAQYTIFGVGCNDGGAGQNDAAIPCDTQEPVTVGFTFTTTSGASAGGYLSDVNADGLLDVVWSFETTSALWDFAPKSGHFAGSVFNFTPVTIQAVWLNTGTAFARSATLSASLKTIPPFWFDTQPGGFDLYDVNGDGAADVVNTMKPAGQDSRAVWLATATGWVQDTGYTSALQGSSIASFDGANSQGLAPVDYNSDGLVDLIQAGMGIQKAYRNTGTTWAEDTTESSLIAGLQLNIVNSDSTPTGVAILDVNGDGLPDLTQNRQGAGNSLYFGQGPVPDLMSQSSTGLGESTQFVYASSTQFDNKGSDGLQHLPIPLTVLTSITRNDGRGLSTSTFTSTLSYKGGFVGQARNEAAHFYCFGSATTLDSRGVTTVRSFAQTEALAGSPTATDVYDQSNQQRSHNTVQYGTTAAGNGVTQVTVDQTDEETTDPGGTVHTRTRKKYDAFLNPTEVDNDGDIAVQGDESKTVYTVATGSPVGVTSALATVTVYDAAGNTASHSEMLYDGSSTPGTVGHGNVTQTLDTIDASGATASKQFSFDQYGNPTVATDANGRAIKFTYDSTSTFRTGTNDPLGRSTSALIDPRFGVATSETDENGQTTTRSLDVLGRLTTLTLPGDENSPNGTASISYENLGDATKQALHFLATETPGQPDTLSARAFIDGFGQTYRSESAAPQGRTRAQVTVFDDVGNAAQQSAPFFVGDAVHYRITTRDALRRTVQITDERGATVNTVYRGSARDDIDALGNKTTTIDNSFGRPIEVDQYLGSTALKTLTSYDTTGHRTQITDASGSVTSISYDYLGRRTGLSDPNVGTFSYLYDPVGNLIEQTGPSGTIAFTYDADGELTSKTFPDGTTVVFTYGSAATNSVGRVSHVVDAAGTLDVTYDPRGQVTERKRTVDGLTFVTGYSRDSMNRIRRVTYPDGYTITYSYDDGGNAAAVYDGAGTLVVGGITYNALGEITGMSFGNGVVSSTSYDSGGIITALAATAPGGATVQQKTIVADANRNVLSIADGRDPAVSQAFSYDALNRLVSAKGVYGAETYAYDEIGNLVQKGNLAFLRDSAKPQQVICALDLSVASSPHNGIGGEADLASCANALLGSPWLSAASKATIQTILQNTTKDGGQIGASTSVLYDASGNIASEPEADVVYTHDAENHLVSAGKVHGPAAEVNVYDATGNRVIRSPHADSTTLYIDDVYEYDEHGNDVRRHLRLGSRLLATSVGKTSAITLITSVPPDMLTQGHASLWRAAKSMLASLGRSTWLGRDAGAWLLLILPVLTLSIVRWRRRIGRQGGRALAVAKSSARLCATHPITSSLCLLVACVLTVELGAPTVAKAGQPPKADLTYYYHGDHLGNTNVITDSSGGVYQRIEYAPYGQQVVAPDNQELDTALNGHYFDPATSLYYFGARHYDPLLGRFVSADSQQSTDTAPIGLHRYAFNANNPIRFSDASGHDVWDVIGAILVVVTAVVIAVFTFGARAGASAVLIGALVGALAGAAIGAVVGLALLAAGQKVSGGEWLNLIFSGAVIGAAAGGAIGAWAIAGWGAASVSAPASHMVLAYTFLGAATGSASGAVLAGVNGRPDDLFSAVAIGFTVGAVTGFVEGEGTQLLVAGMKPSDLAKAIEWANSIGVHIGIPLVNALSSALSAASAGYGFAALALQLDPKIPPGWLAVGGLFGLLGMFLGPQIFGTSKGEKPNTPPTSMADYNTFPVAQ
jgi:RHS repeat-associated protein